MNKDYFVALLLTVLASCSTAWASNCQQIPPGTLRVGVIESPPFALLDAEKKWYGLSVELWQSLAAQQNIRYQFCSRDKANRKLTVSTGLKAVQNRELDMVLGALTVTSPRELKGDFSHPFFHTGLSIATRPDTDSWDELWEWATRPTSLAVVLFLLVMAPLLALVIRRLERNYDQEMLEGPKSKSFATTVLWVTLLCTGRAGAFDMKSFTGRILATLLSFAGVTMLASLVAVATSSTVLSNLDKQITSIAELNSQRVAVMAGTNVQTLLQNEGISSMAVKSIPDALVALMNNQVDAVVHDRPVLQYNIHMMPANARPMLHDTLLNEEYYGFYLQQDSKLRETINQSLPELIGQDRWQQRMNRYLGAHN